ncbi:MAG: glutamine synthetase family protein [Bacteriovoracia bacterium]
MAKKDGKLKIAEQIRKTEGNRVKVAITDIDGVLRGKYLHKDKFLSIIDGGFGFCSVVFGWDSADLCYDNSKFTGWHTGYPDSNAKIDLNTFRQVPWDQDVPFFLADFENDVCPRNLLKKTITKAEKKGFEVKAGCEFEWFNFQETPQSIAEKKFVSPEPITPGMFGYSLLRTSMNQPFFEAIFEGLNQFRVPLEGLHTETGPGVYEAAILYSDALEAADRAILFKTSVKEIAYRYQMIASFMAKWSSTLPGCSGHVHQSLWRDGKNLFYTEKDSNKMSELFKSYLAGQMYCLPEILPFFAPNVNSYKRLVDGYWAPTKPVWGIDNRTTSFRVIPGSSKSTRLETRVAGSDANSYLVIAACIASGLYGIENKLKLKAPAIEGNAYSDKSKRLPRNLQEATEKLANSKLARELFGKEFIDHFVRTREWEWRRFQDAVTSWELERYFEII